MMYALMGLGPAFDLQDWRTSLSSRRDLVRSLVTEAMINGRQLEPMLEEIKRAVRYSTMSEKDRNSFRVMASNTRIIVGGWTTLSPHEREAFMSGKTPYSSTVKLVKQRMD